MTSSSRKNVDNHKGNEKKLTPETGASSSSWRLLKWFLVFLGVMVGSGLFLYQQGYMGHFHRILIPTAPAKLEKTNLPLGDQMANSEPTLVSTPDPDTLATQLAERVQTLESTIKDLEEKIKHLSALQSAPIQSPAAVDHKLLTLLSLQDLKDKMALGLPFTAELQTIKSQMAPGDWEQLAVFAPTGVPSLSFLIQDLKEAILGYRQANRLKLASTWLEKATAALSQLVHVEKISPDLSSTEGAAPGAHNALSYDTFRTLLRQGQIQEVCDQLSQLPHPTPALTLWIDHAKAYLKARDIVGNFQKSLMNNIPTQQPSMTSTSSLNP